MQCDCGECVLVDICADHTEEGSDACRAACSFVRVASDSDAASNPYLREVEAENKALRVKVAEVKEVLGLIDGEGERAKSITAPEDEAVLHLCLQHGYGAVMDSAARQWFLKDSVGSFTVGPCAITVRKVKRLLDATTPGGDD